MTDSGTDRRGLLARVAGVLTAGLAGCSGPEAYNEPNANTSSPAESATPTRSPTATESPSPTATESPSPTPEVTTRPPTETPPTEAPAHDSDAFGNETNAPDPFGDRTDTPDSFDEGPNASDPSDNRTNASDPPENDTNASDPFGNRTNASSPVGNDTNATAPGNRSRNATAPGGGPEQTGVAVRIRYPGEWSGTVTTDVGSQTVSGIGRDTIRLDSSPSVVFAEIQKLERDRRRLTVQILRNGRTVATERTRRPAGSVSLSHSF